MRVTRSTILGWAVVVAYAALLLGAWLATPSQDRADELRDREAASDAERFIDAWERSRSATFVTTGTFERRSEVTGSAIASEDVVAQRPPRRLHRQLGGVQGRVGDQLLVCPAPPEGTEEREPCSLGEPSGTSYEEWVERQLEGLRSILLGDDPLYDVTASGDGCFRLDLRRPDPRAPFGISARFCFDPPTGAPSGSTVRYEGGISETTTVTDIRTEVTDADLEP